MSKRAIVDLNGSRIVTIFEREDHLFDLPYVEEEAVPGPNQMLGPAEITIEATRVVAYRPAVRALSGIVALLDDKGEIIETRNLGPDPVGVKANVYPYAEEKPEHEPATEVLEGPETVMGDDLVMRVWTKRAKTPAELEADARAMIAAEAAEKAAALEAAFGRLGLAAAFEQENRIRKLEGEEPLTLDAFKEREAEKL